MVCGPKAFGTSQRPAWPLDTFGGTALTRPPRASAPPVLTQQHLTWATCLGPHTATGEEPGCHVGGFQPRPGSQNLPSLTDPDRPSPPRAPPGTCSPSSSGPLSWDAPLTRFWHLQTSCWLPTPDGLNAQEAECLGALPVRAPCTGLRPCTPSPACAGEMAGQPVGLRTEQDPRSSIRPPGAVGLPPAMRMVPWTCTCTTYTATGRLKGPGLVSWAP